MFILVLGSSGMLGRAIVKELAESGIAHMAMTRDQLDISNEIALYKVLKNNNITHVINCAAYTDVAGAESNLSLAMNINAECVRTIAQICHSFDIKLIHFSTDYVFDGCKEGSYNESDTPCPLNYYGKSKLLGEEYVEKNCKDYKIFRLQWLYGSNGNNFISKIVTHFNSNGHIHVVNDQFGSPCSAGFVSKYVIRTIQRWDKAPSGIYHLTHDDNCSWYDFASHLFSLFEMRKKVFSIKSSRNGVVVRPDNCVLNNQKVINYFDLGSLGSWKRDIEEFVLKNKPMFKSLFLESKKIEG